MKISVAIGALRSLIREALDANVENKVQELMELPEYESIEAFVELKIEEGESTFSAAEAHAIARNIAQAETRHELSETPEKVFKDVKRELEAYGLKFVGLTPAKNVRGATSNPHGSNPFAGTGGGGSGFSSDFSGGGFTSFGGGPGAVGGGYTWNAGDKRNLSMGSRRR